ncbi:MAG: LptA/OstA family protein [Sulfurovum sp.]|nr:LptA/OstA family protein [Sulfurovum sp.]MCB4759496.1 LptA/OstA family protein [Sulfurovum sp.]
MKYIIILLTAVLGHSLLFAESVQITSDTMKIIDLKKEIHFTGNTKVIQMKNWIYADEIIVYLNQNNKTKKYEAIGSVTFELQYKNTFYKGSAQKITYLPKNATYILKGEVAIEDLVNKSYINGDEVILNMHTGNGDIKGKKKKPVKFIFNLEKRRE